MQSQKRCVGARAMNGWRQVSRSQMRSTHSKSPTGSSMSAGAAAIGSTGKLRHAAPANHAVIDRLGVNVGSPRFRMIQR
ncbi:MAG TPA: hypothetical protein VFB54_07305 [Burkholderiales bacterium]|nr:hypothetical protein [Burkholderiales bacterium]